MFQQLNNSNQLQLLFFMFLFTHLFVKGFVSILFHQQHLFSKILSEVQPLISGSISFKRIWQNGIFYNYPKIHFIIFSFAFIYKDQCGCKGNCWNIPFSPRISHLTLFLIYFQVAWFFSLAAYTFIYFIFIILWDYMTVMKMRVLQISCFPNFSRFLIRLYISASFSFIYGHVICFG